MKGFLAAVAFALAAYAMVTTSKIVGFAGTSGFPAQPVKQGFGALHPSAKQQRIVNYPETLQALPLFFLGALALTAVLPKRKVGTRKSRIVLRAKREADPPTSLEQYVQKTRAEMEETKLRVTETAERSVAFVVTLPQRTNEHHTSWVSAVHKTSADMVKMWELLQLLPGRVVDHFQDRVELATETAHSSFAALVNMPATIKASSTVQEVAHTIVSLPKTAKASIDGFTDSVQKTATSLENAVLAAQAQAALYKDMVEGFAKEAALVHNYLVAAVQFHHAKSSPDDGMSVYERLVLPALRDIEEQSKKSALKP